jgi:hypothetical protein
MHPCASVTLLNVVVATWILPGEDGCREEMLICYHRSPTETVASLEDRQVTIAAQPRAIAGRHRRPAALR